MMLSGGTDRAEEMGSISKKSRLSGNSKAFWHRPGDSQDHSQPGRCGRRGIGGISSWFVEGLK